MSDSTDDCEDKPHVQNVNTLMDELDGLVKRTPQALLNEAQDITNQLVQLKSDLGRLGLLVSMQRMDTLLYVLGYETIHRFHIEMGLDRQSGVFKDAKNKMYGFTYGARK